jgi:hypothetical protein
LTAEDRLPSTRAHQSDQWPPVYELKLSSAQIRALEVAYIDLTGGVRGGAVDRRTVCSLVEQGLMLPSGVLTRRGVDAHVRASGKSDPQRGLARARAGQAEREEATRTGVVGRLRAAGCPLRGGLFLLPVEPADIQEAARLIEEEAERRSVEGRADLLLLLASALTEIEKVKKGGS